MPPEPATGAPHRKSRTPRGHWALVSLTVLVFAIGLLIEGFTHGVLGENNADEPPVTPRTAPAPASVTSGGPVLTVLNGQPRSFRIPPKTVVLSFDDGPDPTWTPKVLAVLSRYHVPANFFVVGAHAASYPGLVRAELQDGDEVGSHTYTHVNLGAGSALPTWSSSKCSCRW